MALKPQNLPGVGWMMEDEDMAALQQQMAQTGQAIHDYRGKALKGRDIGTRNRLMAYDPANRALSEMMGGEQQFDLEALASNSPFAGSGLADTGTGGVYRPGEPVPQEVVDQYAGEEIRGSQEHGVIADEQAMNDQRTVWGTALSPLPGVIQIPGLEQGSATHNADFATAEANRKANATGYQQGYTEAPPWWDGATMGQWDTGENVLMHPSWYQLSQAEQLEKIQSGDVVNYQYTNPDGTPKMGAAPLPAEATTLSQDELAFQREQAGLDPLTGLMEGE